ncbi:hypothetical protein ABZV51_20120 [Streptomyces avermitilis]
MRMPTESAHGPVGVICPSCGESAVRAVEETCADEASVRDGLSDRLAKAPGVTSGFDSGLHFVEGMLMVGVGAALAYSGVDNDKPLYTIGGALLAVLLFVGTILVVRGEARERDVVNAGEHRAGRLWRPAHYCSGCASVFCPGGSPWEGLLTPEQFQKYVWTEAGYGKQLDPAVSDLELPPGIRTGPEGAQDHV